MIGMIWDWLVWQVKPPLRVGDRVMSESPFGVECSVVELVGGRWVRFQDGCWWVRHDLRKAIKSENAWVLKEGE